MTMEDLEELWSMFGWTLTAVSAGEHPANGEAGYPADLFT